MLLQVQRWPALPEPWFVRQKLHGWIRPARLQARMEPRQLGEPFD